MVERPETAPQLNIALFRLAQAIIRHQTRRRFLRIQCHHARAKITGRDRGGRLGAQQYFVFNGIKLFPPVRFGGLITTHEQLWIQSSRIRLDPLREQLPGVTQPPHAGVCVAGLYQITHLPQITQHPTNRAMRHAGKFRNLTKAGIDQIRSAQQREDELQAGRLKRAPGTKPLTCHHRLTTDNPDKYWRMAQIGIARRIHKGDVEVFKLLGDRGRNVVRDQHRVLAKTAQTRHHIPQRRGGEPTLGLDQKCLSFAAQNEAQRPVYPRSVCFGPGGLGRNFRRTSVHRQRLNGRLEQFRLVRGRARFSSGFSFVHNSYLYTIGGQLQILDNYGLWTSAPSPTLAPDVPEALRPDSGSRRRSREYGSAGDEDRPNQRYPDHPHLRHPPRYESAFRSSTPARGGYWNGRSVPCGKRPASARSGLEGTHPTATP